MNKISAIRAWIERSVFHIWLDHSRKRAAGWCAVPSADRGVTEKAGQPAPGRNIGGLGLRLDSDQAGAENGTPV